MKYLILILSIFFSGVVLSETSVTQISPKYCKEGVHKQLNGPFAIFVFCDDALGSNISVFLKEIGAPLNGKYSLSSRFWQGQLWSNDVISFAWMENGSELLVSTSALYGGGALFLLNLEAQESKILYQLESAIIEIVKVSGKTIDLKYEIEHGKFRTVQFTM